jgi:integrase
MPKAARKLTKRDLDKLRTIAPLVVPLEAQLHAAKKAGDKPEAARVSKQLKALGPRALADGGQPGLFAQAKRGKVAFVFRYRPPGGGGRRNMQIDWFGAITLEQARAAAQGLRGDVACRVDPQVAREEARRDSATVNDLVAGYLEDLRERAESRTARRGSPGGALNAAGLLGRHVLPSIGHIRARDLSVDRVRQLHRKLTAAGKGPTANRMLGALQAALAWAERAGVVPVGVNVARLVERNKEEGRRRAIHPQELERLGVVLRQAEAGKLHPSAALAIRLLALTGMRREEVLGLRWSHVDLERGFIYLDDSKTGRQVRCVGAAAVALLRAAKPKGASADDFVCPGGRPGAHFVGIDKIRLRLWRAAKIVATPEGRVDLHSLRHSFASAGADLQHGKFAGMVGVLLGHGHDLKQSITARYVHGNAEATRAAADAISAEIAQLLGLSEPATVIAFPKRGSK